MFKRHELVPLSEIDYHNNDKLNILETGIPKIVLERYLQHPDDVIAIIAQLNFEEIKTFVQKLLRYVNTPEFGDLLNQFFNDNIIKQQILDIYENFVTSVRNKNSVANSY